MRSTTRATVSSARRGARGYGGAGLIAQETRVRVAAKKVKRECHRRPVTGRGRIIPLLQRGVPSATERRAALPHFLPAARAPFPRQRRPRTAFSRSYGHSRPVRIGPTSRTIAVNTGDFQMGGGADKHTFLILINEPCARRSRYYIILLRGFSKARTGTRSLPLHLPTWKPTLVNTRPFFLGAIVKRSYLRDTDYSWVRRETGCVVSISDCGARATADRVGLSLAGPGRLLPSTGQTGRALAGYLPKGQNLRDLHHFSAYKMDKFVSTGIGITRRHDIFEPFLFVVS